MRTLGSPCATPYLARNAAVKPVAFPAILINYGDRIAAESLRRVLRQGGREDA